MTKVASRLGMTSVQLVFLISGCSAHGSERPNAGGDHDSTVASGGARAQTGANLGGSALLHGESKAPPGEVTEGGSRAIGIASASTVILVAAGGTTGGAGGGASGALEQTSASCVSASCGSHKWACWKMPNPTNSALPNPASYVATADIVHDNVTCLDWQRNPPASSYTAIEANRYCSELVLGGFDDWRAPTRIELISILDWTRAPATDPLFGTASGFHKTASNWVLTITQQGSGKGTDYAWGANLSDGIVSCAVSGAKAERIRCVRGNGAGEEFGDKAVAPDNQYSVISAEAVKDNYTGLIWQRDGTASGPLSWDEATGYCDALTLGSSDNWRLPSIRELSTLVDEALVGPAINRDIFPNTKFGSKSNNWYWASDHARNDSVAAWGLNFDDGFTGFNAGEVGKWNYWTEAYAKCVRY